MDAVGLVDISGMILYTIFVTIPEELFIVVFTLILWRRFDLLELKLKNLMKLAVPVCSGAIVANILRLVFGFTIDILPLIGIIVMYSLIVMTYKVFNFSEMLKVFICFVISFLIPGIIQLSYVPLIIYGTNIPLSEFSKPSIMTFILTLPVVLVEVCIVLFILLRKYSRAKVSLIKTVFKSKILTVLIVCVLMFNIVFLWFVSRIISVDKVLIDFSFMIQVLIMVVILTFPVLNVSMLFIVAYNIVSKNAFETMLSKERLKTLMSILESNKDNGDYEKMDLTIDGMNKHISNF